MVDSEKSNTDYPTFDFRPSHVQRIGASPRSVSGAISDFASAKAMLDVLPDENLGITSTLTIWSREISHPSPLPNSISTSSQSKWFDHNCYKEFSIQGTLSTTDANAAGSLWQEWCDWLSMAGAAIEFCEIPQNCSQQLRSIPDPLYRWIYFVHEFAAPELFTWDLTLEQLAAWKQHCDEAGFGEFHHSEADENGTWSYQLGAAVGERLPLGKLFSLQRLPNSFHVCTELRDLIYESRKVLSALGAKADLQSQYVTLDQMAGITNRSKKTLERWYSKGIRKGKLPEPDVEGGGGRAGAHFRQDVQSGSGCARAIY